MRDICHSLANSVEHIQGELPRALVPTNLHLVGNLVDDTWQPTTALAEAEILRVLRPDCSVKRALEICKAIASKLQGWYEDNNTYGDRLQSNREQVMAKIQRYSSSDPDLRHTLNTLMAYQHLWLSSKDRKGLKEVLKSEAQTNTAAIKQIILNMKGAFSKPSHSCRDRLTRAVFEELASPESFTTSHALMKGSTIQKFSIAVGLAHLKEELAKDLQRQCLTIVDDGLADVGGFKRLHMCGL